MDFSRTELLDLLAPEGRYIVRETQGERFAEAALVIKAADGRDLEVDLGGYAFHPVQISEQLFTDLQRTYLVEEDGRDGDGNTVYRLTTGTQTRIAA